MTLNWDNLHIQSREQLCQTSGIQLSIAQKEWATIEPWLRELLQANRYGFKLEETIYDVLKAELP